MLRNATHQWNKILTSKSGLSQLLYCPNFYSDSDTTTLPNPSTSLKATNLYADLSSHTELKFTSYLIDGIQIQSPRRMMWCTDSTTIGHYRFSQNHVPGLPPVPYTPALKQVVDDVQEELNIAVNAVLINIYDDKKEHSEWHCDDDPWLGSNFPVASLSLGGEREFCVRPKNNLDDVTSMVLENGSLVVMDGAFQKEMEHSVPKSSLVVQPRLNLTFRYVEDSLKHLHNSKARWDS
jgi:alkylated DNA repair dioxygenase AlkB